MEIGWDDALAVELAQNVQIIEISHAGVGGGAGHDGFQLFGQNGFQYYRIKICRGTEEQDDPCKDARVSL